MGVGFDLVSLAFRRMEERGLGGAAFNTFNIAF